MSAVPEYPPVFCMGNPLVSIIADFVLRSKLIFEDAFSKQLDLQVRDGEKLLEKYGLKSNDAILAEEKHMPMFV